MKFINLILVLLIFLSLVGCAATTVSSTASNTSTPNTKLQEIQEPTWFMNTPSDDKNLYSAATATSQDLQLSLDKATTIARGELANQVELRVQQIQKRFIEEIGANKDSQLQQMFTQATKQVVSTSLKNSKIKDRKYIDEKGVYRSWVLVTYSIPEANEALLNQIKQQKTLYTKFSATEAYKELDQETQKYEEFKHQQQQQ